MASYYPRRSVSIIWVAKINSTVPVHECGQLVNFAVDLPSGCCRHPIHHHISRRISAFVRSTPVLTTPRRVHLDLCWRDDTEPDFYRRREKMRLCPRILIAPPTRTGRLERTVMSSSLVDTADGRHGPSSSLGVE